MLLAEFVAYYRVHVLLNESFSPTGSLSIISSDAAIQTEGEGEIKTYKSPEEFDQYGL